MMFEEQNSIILDHSSSNFYPSSLSSSSFFSDNSSSMYNFLNYETNLTTINSSSAIVPSTIKNKQPIEDYTANVNWAQILATHLETFLNKKMNQSLPPMLLNDFDRDSRLAIDESSNWTSTGINPVSGVFGSGTSPDLSLLLNVTMLKSIAAQSHLDHIKETFLTDLFDPLTKGIFIIAYIAIGLTGFITNLFFLATILSSKKLLRNPSNFLLLNLFISNTVMSVVCVPFTVAVLTQINWPWGGQTCRIVPVIQGTAVISCSMTITVIAIDRMIRVTRNLPTQVQRSRRNNGQYRTIILETVLIWCVSFLFASPIYFFQKVQSFGIPGVFEIEKCLELWPEDIHRLISTFVRMAIQFILPSVVLTIAHLRIKRHLDESLRSLTANAAAIPPSPHCPSPNCPSNQSNRTNKSGSGNKDGPAGPPIIMETSPSTAHQCQSYACPAYNGPIMTRLQIEFPSSDMSDSYTPTSQLTGNLSAMSGEIQPCCPSCPGQQLQPQSSNFLMVHPDHGHSGTTMVGSSFFSKDDSFIEKDGQREKDDCISSSFEDREEEGEKDDKISVAVGRIHFERNLSAKGKRRRFSTESCPMVKFGTEAKSPRPSFDATLFRRLTLVPGTTTNPTPNQSLEDDQRQNVDQVVQQVHPSPGHANHGQRSRNTARRSRFLREIERNKKVIRSLTSLTVSFILTWLPLNLFNIYLDMDWNVDLTGQMIYLLTAVFHVIAMISIPLNAFSYGWSNPSVRSEGKRFYKSFIQRRGFLRGTASDNQVDGHELRSRNDKRNNSRRKSGKQCSNV